MKTIILIGIVTLLIVSCSPTEEQYPAPEQQLHVQGKMQSAIQYLVHNNLTGCVDYNNVSVCRTSVDDLYYANISINTRKGRCESAIQI